MQQQNSQHQAKAHPITVCVVVQDQQTLMFAESHTAALGVKMSPNIHEVSLASAHAPFFATVMRQPAGTAASADTDASADPQVKQNQQRNIDTQTDPCHILSPVLRSWSYGSDTWQAACLSW